MKNIKKIIIILSIIVILIIFAIIIINKNNNKIPYEEEYIMNSENFDKNEKKEGLQILESRMKYYAVKDCVDKYYLYYSRVFNPEDYQITSNQEILKQHEQENINVLFNMLDSEYKEAKQITAENIKNKFAKIKTSIVSITNIYFDEKEGSVDIYVAEGLLKENNSENKKQFRIIIKIDSATNSFGIIPQDYLLEKYNNLEIGKKTEIIVPETIEQNKNNKVNFRFVEDETYIKDLHSELKKQIQYFPEQIYSNLEQKYKEKCFETLDVFKHYIENNKKEYISTNIEKYQQKEKSDYTNYILIDKYDNYYIFKETAPFKYTLILDNYTIPTEDFTEQYNEKTDEEKVVLNIKRFFMSIDDKNYGSAYSMLAESFKENKYPNKNTFINFVKQNFFEENEIKYLSYEKQNGVYVYKIKILDATEEDSSQKDLNMIVKLKIGTNFELSFGTN